MRDNIKTTLTIEAKKKKKEKKYIYTNKLRSWRTFNGQTFPY